jgi:hypothetical protein
MSMAGYTKLFNSILASTIWRSSDTTRIVWITLLAMSDKDGICEGSIPGLADMARVSIEDCETALVELSSPDKYSRTSEHEGRRIETVDGVGWRLLNHDKYRKKMSEDERREYNRLKQQEYRANKKAEESRVQCQHGVIDGQLLCTKCTHTEADTDTDTEGSKEIDSYTHACAKKFPEHDVRRIEIAVIETLSRHASSPTAKPIRSIEYFTEEILRMCSKKKGGGGTLSDAAIDVMLKRRREQAANVTQTTNSLRERRV